MRTRAYTRKMRAKHIRRKKHITTRYWGTSSYPYYKHDGQYSKGKIHCSCRMCRTALYNGKHRPSIQELRSWERMDYDEDCCATPVPYNTTQEML